MRIDLTSIFVTDQQKALAFYTNVLGFEKKTEMSAGDYSWITVVSPESKDGVQLVLEPNANPAAKAYQEAIYAQGIPATAFTVKNVEEEFERLADRGVHFTMEPTSHGWGAMAIFDDTVGNLIQIQQING